MLQLAIEFFRLILLNNHFEFWRLILLLNNQSINADAYCLLLLLLSEHSCRFSLAWWAYTFPMTGSAIATIYYSLEVPHPITEVMALVLSVISSVTVFSLAIVTLLHLFWGTLFPNDMAIAASSSAACSAMNAASGCCKSRSKRIRNLNDQLHFEFAHEKPPSKKHHHQAPQQPCATDSVHP
jgi:hypothetical protein